MCSILKKQRDRSLHDVCTAQNVRVKLPVLIPGRNIYYFHVSNFVHGHVTVMCTNLQPSGVGQMHLHAEVHVR